MESIKISSQYLSEIIDADLSYPLFFLKKPTCLYIFFIALYLPRLLPLPWKTTFKTLRDRKHMVALAHPQKTLVFTCLLTCNFSFFPTVFSTFSVNFLPLKKMWSANSFSLQESKICCLGKG